MKNQLDNQRSQALYDLSLQCRDTDRPYALKLLHKAAKRCPIAQNDLGMLYFYGWSGVQCARLKGLTYLHLASKNKCKEAAMNLAGIYEMGETVAMDLEQALYFYLLAEGSHIPDVNQDIPLPVESTCFQQRQSLGVKRSKTGPYSNIDLFSIV